MYSLKLIMSNKKVNKNLLPLLAITALMLSVGLTNYSQISDSRSINTQSVLSDSDEKDDEAKIEDKEDGEDIRKTEEKKEEKKDEKKNEDRKEIKVEKKVVVRATEKPETRIEIVDVDEEVDATKDDTENEIEIETETETESEQESETISNDGTVSKFKLKVKSRTFGGKTVVETSAGEVEVESNPEDAINNLVNSGLLDNPSSFEAKTNDKNKIEFEIQGTKSKKFLGIVDVVIPKILTVSSETGEVVSTNQNIWSKLLNLLSI